MKFTLSAIIIMLGMLLGSVRQAAAQDATPTLYKMKCQICHGPDATGSPAGKKMLVKDFTSPDVQKQTDAELLEIAKKGKNKMPAYGGKLTDNQLTELIKYMRDLAKTGAKGK
jgi:cytochrome c5